MPYGATITGVKVRYTTTGSYSNGNVTLSVVTIGDATQTITNGGSDTVNLAPSASYGTTSLTLAAGITKDRTDDPLELCLSQNAVVGASIFVSRVYVSYTYQTIGK